jgi:hypothetical protein
MDIEIIKRKIDNFKKLEKDWNSYGAEPFEESFLESVKEIVDNLPYSIISDGGEISIDEPAVVPGDGGVQLEWQDPVTKKELEIEFNERKIGFLKVYPGNFMVEGEMEITSPIDVIRKELYDLIFWLVK